MIRDPGDQSLSSLEHARDTVGLVPGMGLVDVELRTDVVTVRVHDLPEDSLLIVGVLGVGGPGHQAACRRVEA